MNIRYIGRFPPPYGGVTVKNALLYETLAKALPIKRRQSTSAFSQVLDALDLLKPRQRLIVGVSSVGGKSALITKLLFLFNRRVMNRSVYFMMGGTEARAIASNERRVKHMREFRRIYVETDSMKKTLEKAGLTNAKVYPNCRKRPLKEYRPIKNLDRKLQCVFFSLISPSKGADIALEAARLLRQKNIAFDFYGPIEPSFHEEFTRAVADEQNVSYKGIFRSFEEDVYDLLNEYDILLLPTKCETEGIPGVLAEAKFAAVPAIVSQIAYNAEIIEDGVSGIVLQQNDAVKLAKTIARLHSDRDNLFRLKAGAKASAAGYDIESYIGEILAALKE